MFYIYRMLVFTLLVVFPSVGNASILDARSTLLSDGRVATSLYVTPDTSCINAIFSGVSFDVHAYSLSSVNVGNSDIDLWIGDPQIDASSGTATLMGGFIGGYCDQSLPAYIATFYFTPRSNQRGGISALDTSLVLLHDGRGTRDTVSFAPPSW